MRSNIIESKRSQLARICARHDISYLGLFGSYARGEKRPESDVDLLVDFSARKSLFGVARAHLAFEDLLHQKVDLVIRKNLKPLIRSHVERDLVALYEER